MPPLSAPNTGPATGSLYGATSSTSASPPSEQSADPEQDHHPPSISHPARPASSPLLHSLESTPLTRSEYSAWTSTAGSSTSTPGWTSIAPSHTGLEPLLLQVQPNANAGMTTPRGKDL